VLAYQLLQGHCCVVELDRLVAFLEPQGNSRGQVTQVAEVFRLGQDRQRVRCLGQQVGQQLVVFLWHFLLLV